MSGDESLFNTLALPSGFGLTAVYACRLCGALVPIEPVDYPDRHVRWHSDRPSTKEA